jgi:hypothetical protein
MPYARLELARTFAQARDFAARLQHSSDFQHYLRARLALLLPAGLAFLLVSIGCSAATVIFLADRHPLLALPALILAPLVLLGSFFVQGYVFALWVEDRAIERAIGRRRGRAGLDMGTLPSVPWVLAAALLFAPLALLAVVSPPAAIVLVVLALAMPALYAHLDR